jgi:hypothetical protein
MTDSPVTPETPQPEAAPDGSPGGDPQAGKPRTEEFSVTGDQVLDFLKRMLQEGNVRRIVLKDESGKVLLEIPLTIGVVGVILLPVWAAIGAVAALVAKMTIVVERSD